MTDVGAKRDPASACQACPAGAAVQRREFLRDLVAGVVVAASAIGLGPHAAAALPISFGAGTGAHDDKSYPFPAADGVVIDKNESVIIEIGRASCRERV